MRFDNDTSLRWKSDDNDNDKNHDADDNNDLEYYGHQQMLARLARGDRRSWDVGGGEGPCSPCCIIIIIVVNMMMVMIVMILIIIVVGGWGRGSAHVGA